MPYVAATASRKSQDPPRDRIDCIFRFVRAFIV
jgi:hypothetical protein